MKKVLLIDDDPLVCDLVVDWFGDKVGTEVLCPRRGMLGARMMMSSHFDLAVIDVDLPDISGLGRHSPPTRIFPSFSSRVTRGQATSLNASAIHFSQSHLNWTN